MRRSALGLGAALLLAASIARAGDPQQADQLFKEGRTAFDRRDYATACAKFEQSQAADPATGTLLNLALCEEKLGKLWPARKHGAEVVAALTPKDDRLPLARELVARLDKRLPSLTITLAPGAPKDTVVKDERDGRALPIGAAVPMEPGDHRLVASAPGRPDRKVSITLADQQRATQEITIPEAARAAIDTTEPPPPPPSSSKPLRRTLGYVAGGIGLAGLGGAAITGALLLGKKSEVDAACPDKRCSAEGLRLKAEAEKTPLLPANTASWIIGLAGVGAGAVLILTSLGDDAPPKSARLSVVPIPLPDGGGFSASGSF